VRPEKSRLEEGARPASFPAIGFNANATAVANVRALGDDRGFASVRRGDYGKLDTTRRNTGLIGRWDLRRRAYTAVNVSHSTAPRLLSSLGVK